MEGLIKELSVLGGAGLMFLAYYILHQSTFSVIKTLMERSSESFTQSLQQQTKSFEAALSQMSDWSERLSARQNSIDERNFTSMKEQLEALQVLVASVSRVEAKVDSLNANSKGGRKNA
ncbi:MAG: hypothetical protein II870_08240 [Synergistaceae bacterium]|nr:hypothetical protein [Synergistaceae bacterium]MBQ6910169.1 hypothetical protein [Synergistaceae bacterium]